MRNLEPEAATSVLVKEHLAHSLRTAILEGRLSPGQRVVEGAWSREFGVAQASVREAINALISEGFLVKDAGRSARVVRYSKQDISHLYEVREALEGQAARLTAASGADLTAIRNAVNRMTAAVEHSDVESLVTSDLGFHLALAHASRNPLLIDMITRMLVPFFAFILLRVRETGQGAEGWLDDLPRHRRILDLLAEGDAEIAAQYTRHCVRLSARSAHDVWADSVLKEVTGKT